MVAKQPDIWKLLEDASLEHIRFCNEEIGFWGRQSRITKDRIKKFLFSQYVEDYKQEIEDLYDEINERREFKKQASGV